MQSYKSEFIELALSVGALRFGSFTLKSGRESPYFFNSGLFNTGRSAAALGRFYAAAVQDAGIDFDILFGPAYKGIPLVALTAAALAEHHDRDVPYCFNRKEAKAHGEGGALVVAWSLGEAVEIELPGEVAAAVDRDGRPLALTGRRITATHSPLYLSLR